MFDEIRTQVLKLKGDFTFWSEIVVTRSPRYMPYFGHQANTFKQFNHKQVQAYLQTTAIFKCRLIVFCDTLKLIFLEIFSKYYRKITLKLEIKAFLDKICIFQAFFEISRVNPATLMEKS